MKLFTFIGALTIVVFALYLIYETAALLEEANAQRYGLAPRIPTISEIVRGFEVTHRIIFLIVVILWILFGVWFGGHIMFRWWP